MAAAVNKALETADMVVDMHANPLPSMPFVIKDVQSNFKDEETSVNTQKMAEAFGFTIIEMPYKANQPASIRAASTARGIPALTPELAGNIYIEDDVCRPGTIGLRNTMRAFDMIAGEPERQPVEVLHGHFRFAGRLRANRGGLMVIKKRPGERIAKDETVIDIVNVYGDVVEEVKMPQEGYCWSFTGGIGGTHAISEGDNLAYYFVEVTDVDDPAESASKWF
jgi:predicted deacylase